MGGPGSGRTGFAGRIRTGLSLGQIEIAEADAVQKIGLTWPDSELSFRPMRQLVTDWTTEQRDALNKARNALRAFGIDIVETSPTSGNQRHTYHKVTRMELIRSLHHERPTAVDEIAQLYLKGANDTPHERKFARQKAIAQLWKLAQEGLVKKVYFPDGRLGYQVTSPEAYSYV